MRESNKERTLTHSPLNLCLSSLFLSPSAEPLDKCLARIARNAAPPAERKKKGKGGLPSPPVPSPAPGAPALFPAAGDAAAAATPFPPDTPNGVAWARAGRLEVGGVSYAVVLNPPTVVKVREEER